MKTKSKKFKLDFVPIGQDLKQAREAKDITREQISEIVDYVPRHIQSIENEGKSPSIDLLFQLAGLLDVSLDRHIFKDKSSAKSSLRRENQCAQGREPSHPTPPSPGRTGRSR